jgi:hypothetical protein
MFEGEEVGQLIEEKSGGFQIFMVSTMMVNAKFYVLKAFILGRGFQFLGLFFIPILSNTFFKFSKYFTLFQ